MIELSSLEEPNGYHNIQSNLCRNFSTTGLKLILILFCLHRLLPIFVIFFNTTFKKKKTK